MMINGWINNMSIKSGIMAKYEEDFCRFLAYLKQELNEGIVSKKINFKKYRKSVWSGRLIDNFNIYLKL